MTLDEIKRKVDELSSEERKEIIAYLDKLIAGHSQKTKDEWPEESDDQKKVS